MKGVTLRKITADEMNVLLALNSQTNPVFAKDIATDVDMNSQRISKICKRLAEDKKLVIIHKTIAPYKYEISDQGKLYFA